MVSKARVEARHRVMVIGGGWAGGRFVRAVQYAERQRGDTALVGLLDLEASVLRSWEIAGIPVSTDLRDALRRWKPTVVCICVNEAGHFDVLRRVEELTDPSVLVLCEKPLTQTLEEAIDIESRYRGRRLFVNLVERQSPVVRAAKAYLDEHVQSIARADFAWGKSRVNDPRPTIGDSTELIHPIDLIRYLVGASTEKPAVVHSAASLWSDFHPSGQFLQDSMQVQLEVGETVVAGTSSFLWPQRRRQISLWSVSKAADILNVVLDLDEPHWDDDKLSVWHVSRSGAREQIYSVFASAGDFPTELRGIAKVHRFVESSLDATAGVDLVSVTGAVWLQRALHDCSEISVGHVHRPTSLRSLTPEDSR